MRYSEEVVQKGLQAIESGGLTDLHRLFLDIIPPKSRILEVGCASGYLSQVLRERGHWVTGVEQVASLAALARPRVDLLVEGDFEEPETTAAIPDDHTVILMADVIEHFADPWHAINVLRKKAAPGALWLVTFPNIAHWQMRLRLLRGDWRYTDFGLLDRTHLRFFSLPSVRTFLQESRLELQRLRITDCRYPLRRRVMALPGGEAADRWLQERAANLVGAHFLVEARAHENRLP